MNSSVWLSSPVDAHHQLRLGKKIGDAQRDYTESALRQYKSIWTRFCAFLALRQVNVVTVNAAHIVEFLDRAKARKKIVGDVEKPASPRTLRMCANEIGVVMSHLMEQGIRPDNPMPSILATLKAVHPTPRSNAILPPLGSRARYCEAISSEMMHDPQLTHWGDFRLQQACMALVMSDTGATLKEVQKLVVGSIRLDQAGAAIHLPGHRHVGQRDIEIVSKDGFDALLPALLRLWLSRRRGLIALTAIGHNEAFTATLAQKREISSLFDAFSLELGGLDRLQSDFLSIFPDTAHGSLISTKLFVHLKKPDEDPGKNDLRRPAITKIARLVRGRVIDKTVYAAAQGLLVSAPEALRREWAQGPQTLRNGFCARKIQEGLSNRQVSEMMGLSSDSTVLAVKKSM